ncbi:MAG TPA: sulfate ABC transporter permease subunit CysW [Stellaceae bacterium]|nr:sulfate ABC transporter permease subunit CysW [Stellaceae bacterium]
MRALLILGGVTILVLLLLLPLIIVFGEALAKGIGAYIHALKASDTLAAIGLSLVVALIAVPINTLFGIIAAWCIAKFQFPGRNLLTTLVDLPFSVSPVVSGIVFVLLFGAQGWFGPFLQRHGFHIIFALPALVLVMLFVTLPFVARQLIPLMEARGSDEEEAAISLGASGMQTFLLVTLPNIRWGLFYGVLLCNARAMGEFGAVSVVSGHIRGATITMPLQIEILYNEFNAVAAFAVASLLALLALLTLVARRLVEWRYADELAPSRAG